MLAYALRRLVLAVSLVFGVSAAAFSIFGLSFDPLWYLNLCGTQDCLQQKRELTATLHLHDPIVERYWLWLSALFHHGLGDANPFYGTPRNGSGFRTAEFGSTLLHGAWTSAQLMAAALVLTALLAVVIGVVSARRPGSATDLVLRLLAYVTWSLPSFLVAAVALRWFGPSGWFLTGSPGGGVVSWIRGMTLPAVTLALGLIGLYSRYVRSAMMAELRRPYAVVARSKGLTDTRVAYRHALRNALVPFVSVLALDVGAVLGASLATDYVFQMGGLASVLLGAMNAADPFVLTAIVVAVSVVVALFMFLSDLVVGWLDPRTRVAALA